MALFTDGNITTIHDLTAHDSGLMNLAGVEGIDLTVKLALAQEELGVELAALMPADTRLECVVVTPPLKLWHAFHTLELIYRDAYNNQLNDRYKGKWEQYRELAAWAAGKLLQTGVGITANPVPQAQTPQVGVMVAGAELERTVYVSVAWVNAEGEQGAASAWERVLVPAGCMVTVKAVRPPAVAAGWHVYAGTNPAELSRQNTALLEIGSTWVQTGPLAEDGPLATNGQTPTFLRAMPTVLRRG